MEDPIRKICVNGHDIEEYLWNDEYIVFVDYALFSGTFEEAIRHLNRK